MLSHNALTPWLGLVLLLATVSVTAATTPPPQATPRPFTLTVGAEPRQVLEGFGCSMVDLSKAQIPAAERAEMFDRVFGGLKMNVLRLWATADVNIPVEQMKADFYRRYVDSGVIADARQRGVTTLLLAPARRIKKPAEPMTDYARKLAGFIEAVKRERGIALNATGIANEPGDFTPAQLAEAVRALRDELDARGLRQVAIIAPEWASADAPALRAIEGIKADPAAWAALRGIATHSYNMAATPKFPALIAGMDKQYWMTEASDNGNEGPTDVNRAATIAARFLNDLNQGVTHWIYFIGFHDSADVTRDRDNATKLMVYDRKTRKVFTHLKYDWFRQLRAAFPNGARLYPLTAQPGKDLAYSFGQKPWLNAAAARLADGSWSLGAVNLSGVGPDTKIAKFHPASEVEVTWNVAPLASQPDITFEVYRSDAARRFAPDGTVTMHHGQVRLKIQPHELVTLRSKSSKP